MTISYTGDIGTTGGGGIWSVGNTATGTMTVNGGSDYVLGSSTVPGNSFLQLGVNAGSNGTVTLDGAGSTFTILGSGSDDAGMIVGRVGTGTFRVQAGAALVMTDLTTVANSYVGFTLGRDAGSNGTFIVDGGSVSVTGWASYGNVGRSGAGTFTLTNGGSYSVSVAQDANMQIGRLAGSNGTMTVGAGSSVTLHSGTGGVVDPANSGSSISVGRDGGIGALNVSGSLELTSTVGGAGLNIGRGTGGQGTLNLTTGGIVTLQSSASGAFVVVGQTGGTGVANLTGADLSISTTSGGSGAGIGVGVDGGSGTFTASGSTITIASASAWADILVGGNLNVGGGTGTMVLQNGTTVSASGYGVGINVANASGVSGSLEVLSGSVISVTGSNTEPYDEYFSIGQAAGSGGGVVRIDGAGSLIQGLDITLVGYNPYDGGPGTGDGSLTIDHGGALSTAEMTVGRGGSIEMGAGTVTTDPNGWFVVYEGTFRLLSSGVANIAGNFWMEPHSTIVFEVAADGSASGTINHTVGDFGWDDFTTLIIDPLNGRDFVAGETFRLVQSTGLLSMGLTDFSVTGQDAGFGYAFTIGVTQTDVWFEALNSGNGSGEAIFDFGAASPVAATAYFDPFLSRWSFSGGRVAGGAAVNVDGLRGTDLNDMLDASTSAQAIMLDGRGGIDTLVGGSAADNLLGGGGDDALNGGLGLDRMDGGAGNDRITYDAGDDLANVLGGADFDTLLVFNAAAPTGFDLGAHGFEAAQTIETDDASINPWDSVTRDYDALWHMTQRTIVFDDSTRLVDGYDAAGLTDWSEDRDGANALVRYTNFDQDGTEGGWSSYYDQYSGGVRTQRMTTYDDTTSMRQGFDSLARLDYQQEYRGTAAGGTLSIYTDFDQEPLDGNAWATQLVYYAADGLTRTQQFVTYDNATSMRQAYDSAGRLDWQQEFRDAGGNSLSIYSDFDQDPASTDGWATQLAYYALDGVTRTLNVVTYDNGTSLEQGYAGGVLDYMWEYSDVNRTTRAFYTEFDQDDDFAWYRYVDAYSADGSTVLSRTYYDELGNVV